MLRSFQESKKLVNLLYKFGNEKIPEVVKKITGTQIKKELRKIVRDQEKAPLRALLEAVGFEKIDQPLSAIGPALVLKEAMKKNKKVRSFLLQAIEVSKKSSHSGEIEIVIRELLED